MHNTIPTPSPVKTGNDLKPPVQNSNTTPGKSFPENKNLNQSPVN